MIPITVAVFGARGATRGRGFALSACYVLGIAVTYTGLGMWAALSGGLFGSLLANSWVLGGFALLLDVLGDFKADIQGRWFKRLQRQSSHFVIQRLGGKTLTLFIAITSFIRRTVVTRSAVSAPVLRPQTTPATAAHHEPSK